MTRGKALFLALMLLSTSAQAGWFKDVKQKIRDVCSTQLVGTDPWPYADVPTDKLLYFFGGSSSSKDAQIWRELEWRLNSGRMTDRQAHQFFSAIMGREREEPTE